MPSLRDLPRPQANDPLPLVIYHARCPDGFAAALAAWRLWGNAAQYLPLNHEQISDVAQLPAIDGRCITVLDFSLPAPLLQAMAARAARLVLIDHHRSAADALAGVTACGHLFFDMTQSGAALAWAYFWPEEPQPALVAYVQDRDLWRWKLPDSGAYLAALDMEPWDFARWDALTRLDGDATAAMVTRGAAMEAKFQALAQQLADTAQPVCLGEQAGLMANVPGAFQSLVGDLLAARSGSFALLWTVDQLGVVKCGLRSRAPFDCIALAQAFGGGGHPQACGFRLPVARLPELLGGRLVLADALS